MMLAREGGLPDLHTRKHGPPIVTLLNTSTLDDVINVCSCAGSDKGN